VFGTVRYLGPNTLRKFDAEGYIRAVDELAGREREA
jgi:deoxyribodipyrimidine photo-lyase